MRKGLVVFFIILAVGWISCREQEQKSELFRHLHFDITKNSSGTIDELHVLKKVVPLDTSSNAFILFPTALDYFDNQITIVDRFRHSVKVFNSEGELLEELIDPDNFLFYHGVRDMLRKDSILYIMGAEGKIVEYENGEFTTVVPNPSGLTSVSNFYFLNDNIILYSSETDEYKLYAYSRSEGKIIKKYKQRSNNALSNLMNTFVSPFFENKDGVYYYNVDDNIIYQFTDNAELIPFIKLKFGNQDISSVELPDYIDVATLKSWLNEEDLVYPLSNFSLSDDGELCFSANYRNGYNHLTYSLNKRATLKNLRYNAPLAATPFVYNNDSLMIGYILSKENTFENLSKEAILQYSLDSLSDNDSRSMLYFHSN